LISWILCLKFIKCTDETSNGGKSYSTDYKTD
jgi:hypothetical protein